ncbi:MAG: MFS transporter, partial [Candidatus Promineifilaceae bacterium]
IIGFYLADLARNGHPIDSSVVGNMEASLNIAAFLCAIPFGILIDRYSPRVVLIIGALLGALATQLFALTGLIMIFFVSRALEGAGSAATQPGILAHLTDTTQSFRDLRGKVMSWFELTLFLGIAAGNLLSGVLWDRYGTGSFALLSIFYLLAATVFWWGTSGETKHVQAHPTFAEAIQGLRVAISDSALRRLAMPWLMFNAVVGLWLSQFAFLLNGPKWEGQWLVGLLKAEEVAFFLFVYTLAYAVGVVVGGLYIGKVSRIYIMQVGFMAMFLTTVMFYLLNISGGWPVWVRIAIVIPYIVGVIIQGGFTPAALSYLADVAGDSAGRGSAMGIYSLLLSLGSVIGALMSGWLAYRYAFNGLLFGTLLLATIGLLGLHYVSEQNSDI